MSSFEFVSVLLSIVASLALTHLLTAVARMVRAKEMKFSFLLAGWLALTLFGCVDYWFSLWQARDTDAWTLGYVGLWLFAATNLYLAAWLIVPEGSLDGADLPRFFTENRRRFFVPYAILVLTFALLNSTLEAFGDLASFRTVAGWLLPIVAAFVWPHRWVQVAALSATTVMTALYAVGYLTAL